MTQALPIVRALYAGCFVSVFVIEPLWFGLLYQRPSMVAAVRFGGFLDAVNC